MTISPSRIDDEAARRIAILQHDKTLLVEAGAGTGKTSVMSGRVAYMLAEGIKPQSIVAITFTEFAASELLDRIRNFVEDLDQVSDGKEISKELQFVFPEGLNENQKKNIKFAVDQIDEITCTTIHGFCNKLIRIYPAEAKIDPGASAIDRSNSDILFNDIVENWLRQKLSGEEKEEVEILTEFVLNDPEKAVDLVKFVADQIRIYRELNAPDFPDISKLMDSFTESVRIFAKFMSESTFKEEGTIPIISEFERMAEFANSCTDSKLEKGLVQLLTVEIDSILIRSDRMFKAYQRRGKWEAAARNVGYSKEEGSRKFEEASKLYFTCCNSWQQLQSAIVSKSLADLIERSKEILIMYNKSKQLRGQIDFDDMILTARDMLKNHNVVREELGKRFQHVLVDEFQDTDPIQNEILWRLCGDPAESADSDFDWSKYRIRPGALFLVGDPKQAIYRFRGADIEAYTTARNNLKLQEPDCVLYINRNFRSYSAILEHVNEKFEAKFNTEGQPGFTPLVSNRKATTGVSCVASIDYKVISNDIGEKKKSRDFRIAEAKAVADLCCHLIGNQMVANKESGDYRPCRPGDIALLAPTSTEFWVYEQELENRNIPISTQAGKGLYRRQEVQDLIALTRVLADSRDTLALGALLRGPVVGLTEEELVDIVLEIPRSEKKTDRIPSLSIFTDPEAINHELAREVIQKLKSLYLKRNLTTPYNLLSQAVDELRIRPTLRLRHKGQVDRVLANVDLYLSNSIAYDVRGIRYFSEAMTNAWQEEEKEIEGRPDSIEDAVALQSIHSAKGLEWPIVIPVNTVTQITPLNYVVDRLTNTLYCKVLGCEPTGKAEAFEAEKKELNHERIRLYYVAMTRARDMLFIPRPDEELSVSNTWDKLINIHDPELPSIDLPTVSENLDLKGNVSVNEQTREKFESEARAVSDHYEQLSWYTPSSKENREKSQVTDLTSSQGVKQIQSETEEESTGEVKDATQVQGGLDRGEILHKLMEEVIVGITAEDFDSLEKRAGELIAQLVNSRSNDRTDGLSANELAQCIDRTLNLPEIKEVRPKLQAEFPVYDIDMTNNKITAMSGIVDAITMTENGQPSVIIDWKSDVKSDPKTEKKYRDQVEDYLKITGAQKGYVVFMTSGKLLEV